MYRRRRRRNGLLYVVGHARVERLPRAHCSRLIPLLSDLSEIAPIELVDPPEDNDKRYDKSKIRCQRWIHTLTFFLLY